MSDFKGVIANLCKVLYNLTSIDIKPEHFRLAKFNIANWECLEVFWQVLHKLCCPTVFYPDGCSEDRLHCIISNLSRLGYKSAHHVTADISGNHLLIILGWILWNDVLRIQINHHIYQSPLYHELSNEDKNESMSNEVLSETESNKNDMNYILYLAGKIRLNLKEIGNCLEERGQICDKIHKATLKVGDLPHLSGFDVKLLKDFSLIEDFNTKVKQCKQLLETYSKWKRKSYVFWEWMVSVLEESKKDKSRIGYSEKNEQCLRLYLEFLREEIKKNVAGSKEKYLITKSHRIICKRMILSSDDVKINQDINNIDVDILKLEKECKEKENELNEILAKLLTNRNDITVFKQKVNK